MKNKISVLHGQIEMVAYNNQVRKQERNEEREGDKKKRMRQEDWQVQTEANR